MIQLTKNSASLSLDGVSVIPNPSNGSFQIIFQSSNANNVSVTVYAITGAMVWQQGYSAKEGTNTFNINSELPSGVYIISLNDGVNLSTKRICIR
jgi:hypothetical protein